MQVWKDVDGGGIVESLEQYAHAARTGDRDGVQFAAWQWGCASGADQAGIEVQG